MCDKIARLNNTQMTMLTDKGREMLDFAKNGLKDIENYKNLKFPFLMSELSYEHMDSGEKIEEDEISMILENWNGFQLENNSFVNVGNRKFPRA